jgi:hypothetical protein
LSPASPQLSVIAAAFQISGVLPRAMINGDTDRAQERERELAKEKQRQRQLRDKVQGRKLPENPKRAISMVRTSSLARRELIFLSRS